MGIQPGKTFISHEELQERVKRTRLEPAVQLAPASSLITLWDR